MGTSITIHYEGKEHKDFSTIDLGSMHDKETKSYTFQIVNTTDHSVEDIELVTNLPKSAYSVVIPGSLKPRTSGALKWTVKGSSLFRAKVDRIQLTLQYNVVRRYK